MSVDLTSRIFSQGLTSFRINNFRGAFGAFRSAHQGDPRNPRYLSYYGLTVALQDENVEQGIQICREAIHLVPFEPEFSSESQQRLHEGREAQTSAWDTAGGLGA